jgi:hypothetical protein
MKKLLPLFILIILFLSSCSKECDLQDFNGIYQVDAEDKSCFPYLVDADVKYAVFDQILPFLIVNDNTQYQMILVSETNEGDGCNFNFLTEFLAAGEKATVFITGKKVTIKFTKNNKTCEAILDKK